jgi:hypothetical protein
MKFMADPQNVPFYDDANDLLDPGTLAALGEMFARLELAPSVIHPKRRVEFAKAYRSLSELVKGTGAKITYEIDSPWKNNGSIIIEGPSLLFHPSKQFCAAAELADNVDVRPLVSGHMRMAFLFRDLSIPFDQKGEE